MIAGGVCASAFRVSLGALLAFLVAGSPGDGSAQGSVTGSTVYRLRPESALLRGCFAPCKCPIQIADGLRGSFVLEPSRIQPPFAGYTISHLLFLADLGGQIVPITGSGTYSILSEFVVTHAMTLELQIADEAPAKFEGLQVVGGSDFPLIEIDVSMNGQVCLDTAIQIRAEPAPPDDVDGDYIPNDSDNCPGAFNPDQADRDLDRLGDACDLCPDYSTTINTDFDQNGIGDPCECGDQTQDGVVNVVDIVSINLAIFGAVLTSPLCDTNFDDECDVRDIVGANRKIFGEPAYCSRYPPPEGP